jgi:hypothetical protein
MKRFLIASLILSISVSIYGKVSYDRVVRSKTELCGKANECDNARELAAGTQIAVIDTTEKYGYIFGKKSPWIKIETENGDTGYLLLGEIATPEGYSIEKKSLEIAKNKPLPDLAKCISRSYANLREFDTLFHSVEFITLDSNFTLSSYVYDHNDSFDVFVFSKILGYNGQNPISKLLDVLVVDKRLFKNVYAVSLKDCKANGTNEIGSIIGVYSVKNRDKSKTATYSPEKTWLVNKKAGKIEDFPASKCSCAPEPAGE